LTVSSESIDALLAQAVASVSDQGPGEAAALQRPSPEQADAVAAAFATQPEQPPPEAAAVAVVMGAALLHDVVRDSLHPSHHADSVAAPKKKDEEKPG
jgi:hypothetical protein